MKEDEIIVAAFRNLFFCLFSLLLYSWFDDAQILSLVLFTVFFVKLCKLSAKLNATKNLT
jgi:hypothetical protein